MKKSLIILSLSIGLFVFGQTKGKITYKLIVKKDSLEQPYENSKNTEAKNGVLEMLHDAQPIESYLVFNNDKSIYYADPDYNIPKWENFDDGISLTPTGVSLTWLRAGGKGLYYNDFSKEFHIKQTDVFGPLKRLIVEKKRKWILKDETKIINGYLCNLAVIEKLNNKKLKAWYTTEVPIKHAPTDYFGLPGLIVKIEDVIYSWTITKIDFESNEADIIEEPTEGDLITLDEYRRLAGNPFGKE